MAYWIAVSVINYEWHDEPDAHYIYIIQVNTLNSSWKVNRRFSEFFSLHTQLKKNFKTAQFPTFPSRFQMKSQSPEVAEQRKKLFDNYLKVIAHQKDIVQGAELQAFLNLANRDKKNMIPEQKNDNANVVTSEPPPTVEFSTRESIALKRPSKWQMSKEEKESYDKVFIRADDDNDGLVTGEQARVLFGKSGLPMNLLAQIWKLSDIDSDGKLDVIEFAIAMHLINGKLKKDLNIPSTLPSSLSALKPASKVNAIKVSKQYGDGYGNFADPLATSAEDIVKQSAAKSNDDTKQPTVTIKSPEFISKSETPETVNETEGLETEKSNNNEPTLVTTIQHSPIMDHAYEDILKEPQGRKEISNANLKIIKENKMIASMPKAVGQIFANPLAPKKKDDNDDEVLFDNVVSEGEEEMSVDLTSNGSETVHTNGISKEEVDQTFSIFADPLAKKKKEGANEKKARPLTTIF